MRILHKMILLFALAGTATPGFSQTNMRDPAYARGYADARRAVDAGEPVPVNAPDAPGRGSDLSLMCVGGGSANKLAVASAFGWNSLGFSSSAMAVGQRSQGFEDQVSLHITGGEGQLRMPRTMLPEIRGGKDGWFKLKNLRITDQEITASAEVNVVNNPKIRLDRYSGMISISGKAGDYVGRCQRFIPGQTQRQF